ncbi:class II aldolase/adducin family protein [Georgenia yuyongxinii]
MEIARRFAAERLATGTGGNFSIAVADELVITPSAVPYADLAPEMMCVISRTDGATIEGEFRPSSEWEMHLTALEATGASAVVHTHSVAATAVASLAGVEEVPPFHYYMQILGGPVRVTEYARYGSPLLARRAAAALEDRTACLLGNHGAVLCDATLDGAFEKALELEWLCDMYLRIRGAGEPRVLSTAQLEEVQRGLATYINPALQS